MKPTSTDLTSLASRLFLSLAALAVITTGCSSSRGLQVGPSSKVIDANPTDVPSPTAVTAVALSGTQIQVSWVNGAANLDSNTVLLSQDTVNFQMVGSTVGS